MASLRPFNTSTKEAKSFKLRNSQLSSKDSERLDTDNFKMEQRLRELKLSMDRQKQERYKVGPDGCVWSSGKAGAVTTIGTDLLRKEPSKPADFKGKPRKIRVLKDVPLDVPKRTSFKERTSHKLKGPACGQCEQKSVSLACMECGENYCTTCFAKFHLKGALKNHRSVPVQGDCTTSQSLDLANGQSNSSKRSVEGHLPKPPTASQRITSSDKRNSDQTGVTLYSMKPEKPSDVQTMGGALLQGTFSEEESSHLFSQALDEWRSAKQNGSSRKPQLVTTASGTSTDEVNSPRSPIRITFQEDTSLTYADRLLLKKHRRADIPPLTSNSMSQYSSDGMMSIAQNLQELAVNNEDTYRPTDEDVKLLEEHDRYTSIFAEMSTIREPRLQSALSIVEVNEVLPVEAVEVELTYSVEEVDDPVEQALLARGDGTPEAVSGNLATEMTHPSARSVTDSSSTVRNIQSMRPTSTQPTRPAAGQAMRPTSTQSTRPASGKAAKPTLTQSSRPAVGQPSRPPSGKASRAASTQQTRPTSTQQSRPGASQPLRPTSTQSSRPTSTQPSRPATGQPTRPALSKATRPASCQPSRPTLTPASTQPSRPGTSQPSRPTLTPASRPASTQPSRPASGLTSSPSSELISASHLPRQTLHHYKAGLGDFFLAGLGWDAENDPTKTDSSTDNAKQIGSQLPNCSYKGSVQAWRPQSSLPASQTFSPSPPRSVGSPQGFNHCSKKIPSVVNPHTTSPPHSRLAESMDCPIEEQGTGPLDNKITWLLSEHPPHVAGSYEEDSAVDLCGSRNMQVDGDDDTDVADRQELDKLTWELASQSGRITADGHWTSLNLPDVEDFLYHENSFSQDVELGILQDAGVGSGLSTPFGHILSHISNDDEQDCDMEQSMADVAALIG